MAAEMTDPELLDLLAERARTMRDFTPDHRPMNMYAIFRKDLGMSPEKIVPQCGHAYHLSLRKAEAMHPGITERYEGTGNGTKICMYAKNTGQLERAYMEAKAAGLPCVYVIDRGHVIPGTPFDGNPILTAIGIGPCFKDEAEHITKRLTLYRT